MPESKYRHTPFMIGVVVTLLAVVAASLAVVAPAQAQSPGVVFKGPGFEMVLLPGWTPTDDGPAEVDGAFTRALPGDEPAHFFLRSQVLSVSVEESNLNPADMAAELSQTIEKSFPQAVAVDEAVPDLGGTILAFKTYDLVEKGKDLRRRFVTFAKGKTYVEVVCDAPVAKWDTVRVELDVMLAALRPVSGEPARTLMSDEAAVANLMETMPALLSALPHDWTSSLLKVVIGTDAPGSTRRVAITLQTDREDARDVYEVSKLSMQLIQEKHRDVSASDLPETLRPAVPAGQDFMGYLAAVWGFAFSRSGSWDPPIDTLQILLVDARGEGVGSISIAQSDFLKLMSGELESSDVEQIARMFVFEAPEPASTPAPTTK